MCLPNCPRPTAERRLSVCSSAACSRSEYRDRRNRLLVNGIRPRAVLTRGHCHGPIAGNTSSLMFARMRRVEALDVPPWFTSALGQEPAIVHVDVRGSRIRSRVWGDPSLSPLVLVHGGRANASWWDHVAPFFSQTHHVIAPDLSGHGDSDFRASYDLDIWAEEVLAVSAAASSRPPTIVGHSLGGWVTAIAATSYGKQIDSILLIDSPLRESGAQETLLGQRNPHTTTGHSKNDIISQFRARPPQPMMLPFIAHHIALKSIRKTSSGWMWKADPAMFCANVIPERLGKHEGIEEMMAEMPCRQAYLRCEYGLVPSAMAERIRSIMQLRGPFIDLPEAGHHPMLDQPLPLVAALRALLEFWSIT